MEKIQLTTEDNVEIAGSLWEQDTKTCVLLVHMMPQTKESWKALAARLFEARFAVFAIDLRGHGESGGGDYKTFTAQQHQAYTKDIDAALVFLRTKFPSRTIVMGGASIGANLSLKYLAEDKTMPKAFALSAGLDYHGFKAADYVDDLSPEQSVLLAGSSDDKRGGSDCGAMAEQLYDRASSRKQKFIYETGGHGTDMLAAHPELMDEIVKFLK